MLKKIIESEHLDVPQKFEYKGFFLLKFKYVRKVLIEFYNVNWAVSNDAYYRHRHSIFGFTFPETSPPLLTTLTLLPEINTLSLYVQVDLCEL